MTLEALAGAVIVGSVGGIAWVYVETWWESRQLARKIAEHEARAARKREAA